MNVNIDEAIIFLLRDNLELKAKVNALETVVLSLAKLQNPAFPDAISEQLKERESVLFQTYLLNHPFLKDDFEDFVEGL